MQGIRKDAWKAAAWALGISLVLGLVSLAVLEHDRAPRQALLGTYMNSPLFSAEQVVYIDYRQRLVSIYQQGREEDIAALRALRKNDPEHFARVVLSDRSFYPYIKDKGRLYFEPRSYQDWLQLRQELRNDYEGVLLAPRLSLRPEGFHPVHLIAYPFAEDRPSRLMFDLAILAAASALSLFLLGAARTTTFVLTGIVLGGAGYGLLADAHAPVLQGWTLAALALIGALAAHTVLIWRQGRLALTQRYVWVTLMVGSLTVILHLIFNIWFWQRPLVFLPVAFMVVVAGAVLRLWLGEPDAQAEDDVEEHHSAWRYRVELARALESIAQLRFDDARRMLKSMVRRYPEEIEVIRHLYLVEKLWPEEDTYWACAQELIQFAVRHNHYDMALMLFQDIQQHASTKAQARERLAPEFYHKMMMVFVHHNDLNRAEQSFLFLELAGESEIIKDACLLLKEEFKQRRDAGKMQQYDALLQQL